MKNTIQFTYKLVLLWSMFNEIVYYDVFEFPNTFLKLL